MARQDKTVGWRGRRLIRHLLRRVFVTHQAALVRDMWAHLARRHRVRGGGRIPQGGQPGQHWP